MEEAAAKREAARRIPLSAEEVRLRRERDSLELSRTRVRTDLEAATDPRRRGQLEAALHFLEEKIARLGNPRLDNQ